MGLLDALFGGGAQGAPQDPNAQAAPAPQGGGFSLTPLAQSLLAGYFSAIGSPKLAGATGALSRGGLAALGTYQDANYQQQKGQLETAYYKRAMAQADKADAASRQFYYDPTTKTYHVVDRATGLPPQGSLPETAIPGLVSAQNKSTAEAKPTKADLWNPKTGRSEPVYVKPGEHGETLVGGQTGYVPIGETGYQSKGPASREDALQTVNQAMFMGNQLLGAMDKVDAEGGPPGQVMDVLGGLAYRYLHRGLPGQASQNDVRGYTQTLKQQLMGAAQKMSGSRAFQFVKLIQDHFPDMLDEASFKRGKLKIFLGENGVLKQIDHNIRYGASDDEVQAQADKYDQMLKASDASPENTANDASAAPPPPPVIPVGDLQRGPNGQLAIDGVDGGKYLYTPGIGWQKIRQ